MQNPHRDLDDHTRQHEDARHVSDTAAQQPPNENDLERRKRELDRRQRVLREAARSFTSEHTTEDTLQRLVDLSRELTGARYSGLMVYDAFGGVSQFFTSGLPADQQAAFGTLLRDRARPGDSVRAGRSLRVSAPENDPQPSSVPEGYRPISSLLGVPVGFQGRVFGALFVAEPGGGGEFSDDDETALTMLGHLAAATMEQARIGAEFSLERNALESVLNSLNDAVYTVRLDRSILRLNQAALALAGAPVEQVQGRPCWEVFRYVDDMGRSICETACPLLGLIGQDAPPPPTPAYLLSPGGGSIPVALTAVPVRDARGRVTGMVHVFRDLSHQRALDEMKSNLLSMVSHELRTPLGHIKGYVSALLQSGVDWDAGTQRDFLEGIDRQADRLGKLVGDLLEMTRLEAGNRPQPVASPPAALAHGGVRMAAPFLRGHVLVVTMEEPLPWVLADPPQIERVLANLLENAAKFSPLGAMIALTAAAHDNEVVFAVADRGIGVDPAELGRIFEKFYRVERASGRTPGAGLGLAICKNIVTAHHGRIWAESNPGGGTVFRFTLPVARPEESTDR